MIIRPADISDSFDILEWRNDPRSCSMFISSDRVNEEQHRKWFQASLNNPLRYLYVGVLDEKKVGVCRFDYDHSSGLSEISINLNPAMRGLKLSFIFLEKSISKYRETSDCTLLATIKKDNEASLRLFRRFGFVLSRADDNFYYYVFD